MKKIDVSIIIVSYNTVDFLRNCLQSVKHNISDKITYEVIVVDNASSDTSVEMVRKEFPDVKLIANKTNDGFSKANNLGVPFAKGRYVLFLNSDTIVNKNTLETMVEFMDNHLDAGASTCFLRMSNGELDDASHRGFPTPWNAICHFSGLSALFPHSMIFNGYHMAWKDLDKVHEIDTLAGAFMLVRREAGEQVKWWDEDYFFYGEDIDFCFELKQHGWKIYFVPTVEILHYKGVSGGIKKESQTITKASLETRIQATKARFDAMKIFYKKNYVGKYPSLLTSLVLKGIEVRKKLALRKLH